MWGTGGSLATSSWSLSSDRTEWCAPQAVAAARSAPPDLPFSAQLRYANNSQYKNDTIIRKEVYVSPAVLAEVKRIVVDSEARALAASPRRAPRPASRRSALLGAAQPQT